MAASAFPTRTLSQTTGTAPTFGAANVDGNFVAYNKNGFLVLKTAGTGSTVTVVVPGSTSYGAANPDITYTLAATDEKWIPLGNSAFRDSATGTVSVTYTSVTTMTGAYVVV